MHAARAKSITKAPHKPLLEVEPTTLRLVLVIHSLEFRSFFPHIIVSYFSNITLLLLAESNIFAPVVLTLTYEMDRYKFKINHHVVCLVQR